MEITIKHKEMNLERWIIFFAVIITTTCLLFARVIYLMPDFPHGYENIYYMGLMWRMPLILILAYLSTQLYD